MENIDGGFILLARKMLDSDIFAGPPLRLKMFLWMLMKANFKDRDKLKRGQLITSVREMREALSYSVGYRKKYHTTDEIRRSYEGLVNAEMIAATKAVRGVVVTILNYDKYQDIDNYERRNESRHENGTKAEFMPNVTEEREEREEENINTTPLTPLEHGGGCVPDVEPPARVQEQVPENHSEPQPVGPTLLTCSQGEKKEKPKRRSKRPGLEKYKTGPYTQDFEEFWKFYPRRDSKRPAFVAWGKLKETGRLPSLEVLKDAVSWKQVCNQWKRGFIPYPGTWLNNLGWEDEEAQPPTPKDDPDFWVFNQGLEDNFGMPRMPDHLRQQVAMQ